MENYPVVATCRCLSDHERSQCLGGVPEYDEFRLAVDANEPAPFDLYGAHKTTAHLQFMGRRDVYLLLILFLGRGFNHPHKDGAAQPIRRSGAEKSSHFPDIFGIHYAA